VTLVAALGAGPPLQVRPAALAEGEERQEHVFGILLAMAQCYK